MKALLKIAGLLVVLLAVAIAAFVPWRIPAGALQDEIRAQIETISGLAVKASGPVVLTLAPRPTLRLEGLQLASPHGGIVAEIETLRGHLRLLPLIGGRFELAAATLMRPTLVLDLDRLESETGGRLRAPVSLAIESGVIRLTRPSNHLDTVIERLDGTVDWPAATSAASLRLKARWRQEDFTLAGWLARPAHVLAGQGSGLTVQIQGAGATLLFDGEMKGAGAPRLDGRLAFSTPALGELAALFDMPKALPGALGPFSAQGRLTLDGALALSGSRLSLDGNEFEGSLSVARGEGGALTLGGTLATGSLDVSGWFAGIAGAGDRSARWNHALLAWRDLAQADLDLRLSASKVSAGPYRAEEAAIAVLLKAGRLEMNLVDMRAYGGRLKGRLTLAPPANRDGEHPAEREVPDMRGMLSFSGVDLTALSTPPAPYRLTGKTSAQISFETAGESLMQAARNLDGQIQFSIADGELSGLDLRQALDAAARNRPLALAGVMQKGRSPFDRLAGQIHIVSGMGAISETSLKGPGFEAAVSGRIDVPGQTLDVSLRARHEDNPVELPVEINGPWAAPTLRLDVETILRQIERR